MVMLMPGHVHIDICTVMFMLMLMSLLKTRHYPTFLPNVSLSFINCCARKKAIIMVTVCFPIILDDASSK